MPSRTPAYLQGWCFRCRRQRIEAVSLLPSPLRHSRRTEAVPRLVCCHTRRQPPTRCCCSSSKGSPFIYMVETALRLYEASRRSAGPGRRKCRQCPDHQHRHRPRHARRPHRLCRPQHPRQLQHPQPPRRPIRRLGSRRSAVRVALYWCSQCLLQCLGLSQTTLVPFTQRRTARLTRARPSWKGRQRWRWRVPIMLQRAQ